MCKHESTMNWLVDPIGSVSRVFTNDLGDLGLIPGWVIPKTQKMVLDATLLNVQYYQGLIGAIKGKELHPPLHLGLVAFEKEAFGLPLTIVTNFYYYFSINNFEEVPVV